MMTKRALSPFALSLSKGFSFLKGSEELRHSNETSGSFEQPERRRGFML